MAEKSTITPGLYTVQQILEVAGYDHSGITDFRTVKIDGLGFDDLDKQIRIPEACKSVSVTEDGKEVAVITVEA